MIKVIEIEHISSLNDPFDYVKERFAKELNLDDLDKNGIAYNTDKTFWMRKTINAETKQITYGGFKLVEGKEDLVFKVERILE